jgi:hypothetical protein
VQYKTRTSRTWFDKSKAVKRLKQFKLGIVFKRLHVRLRPSSADSGAVPRSSADSGAVPTSSCSAQVPAYP